MKKTLILTLGFVLFSTVAKAYCWSIRDNDAQKLCLAKTKNDSSYCWQIRDNDTQKECMADVKHERSYCWQIRNENKKQACLAMH